MTATRIITGPCSHGKAELPRIELEVDRATLAKRRWLGVAKDGREFGFDLETPLHDGVVFFVDDAGVYGIAQRPEPVIEIAIHDGEQAARVAWSLGNLHFPVEVGHGVIRVVDDPAVRLCLERDHVPYAARVQVFHPIQTVAHGHGHSHRH